MCVLPRHSCVLSLQMCVTPTTCVFYPTHSVPSHLLCVLPQHWCAPLTNCAQALPLWNSFQNLPACDILLSTTCVPSYSLCAAHHCSVCAGINTQQLTAAAKLACTALSRLTNLTELRVRLVSCMSLRLVSSCSSLRLVCACMTLLSPLSWVQSPQSSHKPDRAAGECDACVYFFLTFLIFFFHA